MKSVRNQNAVRRTLTSEEAKARTAKAAATRAANAAAKEKKRREQAERETRRQEEQARRLREWLEQLSPEAEAAYQDMRRAREVLFVESLLALRDGGLPDARWEELQSAVLDAERRAPVPPWERKPDEASDGNGMVVDHDQVVVVPEAPV